ncbi:MAG: phosphatidate cytidylyltransferase [Bacteroidales bacterium]|nr:phosphatidate cytidylyltransferase [Bacteroidales bacterium]
MQEKKNPFLNIGTTLISFVYLVIPFALLNFIYAYGSDASGPDYTFILSFFIIVWINDSLAYLATGLLAGRNKLFARISPKKTWEGFAGGFLFSMAAGAGFAFFFESPHIAIWLIYAACIAIFATFGDLIESMLKRNFEVKDSGSILPGHGGMLDRFDGVLLASPAVFLYLNLI